MKVSKIISPILGLVLATTLGIGNYFAFGIYESLLDVYFSGDGNYEVTETEKEVCEHVVKEGIVLLKNDNALPLSEKETKVALFGQNSVDFVYGGSGSGSVDTSTAPTLKTAMEKHGFTVNQTLWNFYETGAGKSYRKKTPNESGKGVFAVNEVPRSVYTSAVKDSLKESDVAVVVVGRSGGESADIPTQALASGYKYLQIDKDEQDMIEMACESFNKVILLLNTNNPIELGFLEEAKYANVKAALWVGGVGQEGMYAIPQVLNGTVNPSGKLVDTYAYDSTSAPSYQNLGNYSITNGIDKGDKYIVYAEGIYVGYRYYETRYEDVTLSQGNAGSFDYDKTVQFPFGYGLSYTNFTYDNFEVKASADGKSYEVSVDVTNEGSKDGKDVLEIYAQKPYDGMVETSAVDLVGFVKTETIKAGETLEDVTITVDKQSLASYDYKDAKTYVLTQGNYYLALGTDAHDAVNNILAAKGKEGVGNSAFAKKIFTQESKDSTTFAKSVTGYPVTNQMEDVDVNYPAYGESLTYLSRSDWTGTFPTTFKNGSWTAQQSLVDSLQFYDIHQDTTDDEAVNAFTYTTNSTATQHKVQDLTTTPLSDAKWDEIITQLSWTQMTKLIRLGGYSTQSVDRIGLPKTIDKDGPAGISGTLVGGVNCMAWPAEIVMASTWNVDLIEEVGVNIGADSISSGVAGWYAPGVDIHRSPYSGRNFEYYSEDGFLSGKIGAAEMSGVRSKGVIAYMKHFALNDQETNRYGGAIFANEQAIREIFIKGFEYVTVEGKATAAMAAMNRVGTRWVGAHRGLMTEVLRNEWGFEGVVITDQASVPSMFYQDMISGLWAGTDMWLNTDASFWSLESYKNDPTVQYYIHRAAKNIVYAVTNSNAVINYDTENVDGAPSVDVEEIPNNGFNWRLAIYVLDGVVFAASALMIVLPFVGKKKKNVKRRKR